MYIYICYTHLQSLILSFRDIALTRVGRSGTKLKTNDVQLFKMLLSGRGQICNLEDFKSDASYFHERFRTNKKSQSQTCQ